MKKSLLHILLVSITIINCNQVTAQTETQQGWTLLDESGYSVQYPNDWDLDKSGQFGTKFFLFSKQTSAADTFKENVNLIVQDLTGHNLNLDQYAELSTNQIKTMMVNGNLVSSKKEKRNGVDFQHVVYTGDQGTFKLKFEQYYWVIDNKAYVLTFTAEASQFDTYKETAKKVMDSFKLK